MQKGQKEEEGGPINKAQIPFDSLYSSRGLCFSQYSLSVSLYLTLSLSLFPQDFIFIKKPLWRSIASFHFQACHGFRYCIWLAGKIPFLLLFLVAF